MKGKLGFDSNVRIRLFSSLKIVRSLCIRFKVINASTESFSSLIIVSWASVLKG
jgi:hypothetical protein